ncbi:MAG: hypothetical protein IJ215_01595 [Clostridia bacterium]|nr:hypothetical protein [Clostridia bacterium]
MNMKSFVFAAILSCASFILWACSSDDPSDNHSYYVKYEFKVVSKYIQSYNINFFSENGDVHTSTKSKDWEEIHGPFKLGDEVFLGIAATNHATITGRISVSIDQEPFVVKQTGEGLMGLRITHRIGQ